MTRKVKAMSFDRGPTFLVRTLHVHLILHLAQDVQQELMSIMLLE